MRLSGFLVLLTACGSADLDAGTDHPRGVLPFDNRNPFVICNDGPRDNWQGEFAMAMASSGQIKLVGIVVHASATYPDLDKNVQGWRDMVSAARTSGMRAIPDPIGSVAPSLVRPADATIESTVPNRSEGARALVDLANRLSQPVRPLVIADGGRLTDVADAYLIDPSIVERVVVVAQVGQTLPGGAGAVMNSPNGDLDPWATEIVARKFLYVQMNAYYTQTGDIPADRVSELPNNPFGAWMAAKIPEILPRTEAGDQSTVVAGAMPTFARSVSRLAETGPTPDAGKTPTLVPDPNGRAWLVPDGDHAAAAD